MGSLRLFVIYLCLFWVIACWATYLLTRTPVLLLAAAIFSGIALLFILIQLYHSWRNPDVH